MEDAMSKGFPSMTALLGLIAVAGYQNRDKMADMMRGFGANNPQPARQGSVPGGLENVLGTALTSAGAGGLLSNGLGELLERFKQNGRGDVAQSWINRGPNQDIAPDELHAAIGPDVLDELSQRTGLSREELLVRLSKQLPTAVDRYTPEGQLPRWG
jgi:uncharacterized protein YidB (DUF937 family)